MIRDALSVVALVVGLILSVVNLNQLASAPAVKLKARVESSLYKTHPSIQWYIETDLKDVSELEFDMSKRSDINEAGLNAKQISVVAKVLRQQAYETKYNFNNDARTFLVYTVENAGDKAAPNVALVNYMSGVAFVEGSDKSVAVRGKEPVDLGEIPPRSSKKVYFWSSDYYYSRSDDSFVKYPDGTVNVEATVPLGGWYKHFNDYIMLYNFVAVLIVLAAVIAGVTAWVNKRFSKVRNSPHTESKKKPRRRRSKQKTLSLLGQ
ncbi:hypothetical protein [Pseudomonas putida]|uniref:hypothetical protein n=1 Tax=Pseudomonas putida TaxID=303 RepID=UPI0022DCEFD8|nr:hypothetical protein [Pseudomonas putida]WBM44743.1 hypothetical protein M2J85_18600 [Pseudomonas putida]